MRNTIEIIVENIGLSDFNSKLPAPALVEENGGGVLILFSDMDELSTYANSLILPVDQSDEHLRARTALQKALDKVLDENQVVIKSIKAFAKSLASFIFDAEAHREDKLAIFDSLLENIRTCLNSWELESAIKDSIFELGVQTFDPRLDFYQYAHNEADFNFEQIKNRLIKDLLTIRLGLK